MELRGMVVVNGMAQLVDNDEIAQMLRKRHQEKAQRNVVRPGTAPPLRTRGTDRQLVVLQPRDAGEPTDTVGQVGFGGAPQLFDAGFFRGRRQLRRECRTPLRKPCPGRLDPSGFALEKLHRSPCGNPARKRQADTPRPAHADRNTACAARLGEDDLTQPGMFDGRNHA